MITRVMSDAHDVTLERLMDPDLPNGSLSTREISWGEDGSDTSQGLATDRARKQLLFFNSGGIAQADRDCKSVQLGFGQRIGAVMLQGVLGRDDEKRRR